MARSRKTIPKETNSSDGLINTKQEVWDVLEFARALMNTFYPGILTSELVNSQLKNISYSPLAATEKSLNDALLDPKNSEQQLRSFVEHFELVSAPVRRIIAYLSSMLQMNIQYTVINADPDDYRTAKFKKDEKIVFDILDRFDWYYHFQNVTKQVLRNELFVGSIRDDGDQIVLQELPVQYCRLSSKWDYGYGCDLDFYLFLQPGISLDGYAPFFKRKFDELFSGENGYQSYHPFINPELRGSSQWIYWVSLPPEQGFVFKLDPSLAVAVPYLSAILPEFVNQSVMRNLQRDINISAATRLLIGQVPLLKEQGAKLSSALAVDPKTAGQFLGLVKNALSSAVNVAIAPLENINAVSFPAENDLYDSYLRQSSNSSGFNSQIFYSGKLKNNALESELSFQSDSLLVEKALYPQFANMFKYYCNKRTSKFKYNFWFSGNSYYLDRQRVLETANTLATNGIVLPQLFANALNVKPQDFIRMLEQSKSMDFVGKYITPITPGFQQSATKTNGRPQKSESDLTESGSVTREAGSNLEKGGNI